ncbi:MAG: ParB N-terminal domain-containing protein [Defluviitaleaceae bacterium]|nr:ParB N-terminal domain-containing protein [Defluviitaleaceae bacterium]
MPNNKNIAKPRLQNLDDLFQLNDGVNPLEQTMPIMQTQPANKRAVTSVAVEQLTPFKDHPFHLYAGERLDDMVASIKANGVLVPIIVRKVGSILEILSGHNRVEAAKLTELTEVPALVFEDISDEDAMVYVVETNLIQRSFKTKIKQLLVMTKGVAFDYKIRHYALCNIQKQY